MKKTDKVICIDDKIEDPNNLIPNKPRYNEIYTIRDHFKTRNGDAVHLVEISNPHLEHPSGLGSFEPSFSDKRFAVLTEDDLLKLEEINLMEA